MIELLIVFEGECIMLIHDDCCNAINSLFNSEWRHKYQILVLIYFVHTLCLEPNVLICHAPLMH